MQISGQIPVVPVVTPAVSSAKAPGSAVSPEALASTLAPAQPLEALAPGGTATDSLPVYTRQGRFEGDGSYATPEPVVSAEADSGADAEHARQSSESASRTAPVSENEAAQPQSRATTNDQDSAPTAARKTSVPEGQYDELDLQKIRALTQRDRLVRQHEQAHAAVGGGLAGAPSFAYERGPDGRQYAVSGEVPIDASPIPGDPQATLRKMEQVRRAALAPADPSAQDRMVAARATQAILQARAELLARRREAALERTQTDTAADRQGQQNAQALTTYDQLSRYGETGSAERVPDLTEVIA